MKKLLLTLSLAALVAAGWTLSGMTRKTLADRGLLERQTREAAGRLVNQGAVPTSHGVGVFIPEKIVRDTLRLLEGTVLRLPGTGQWPADTELVVDTVELSTTYGGANLVLGLTARSAERGLSVGLRADGIARVTGVAEGKQGRELGIALSLVEVQAQLGWRDFNFRTKRFCGELIASAAMGELGERLAFALPLPPLPEPGLQLDEQTKVPVGGSGSLDVQISSPRISLRPDVEFTGGLFLPGGVWLLADRAGKAPVAALSDEQALDAFATWIANAAPVPKFASVWVQGAFLADSVNALPIRDFKPTAQVTATSGNFFHTRHDFLGKGGLEVMLNNNEGKADAKVTKLVASWAGPAGLRILADFLANAEAGFRIKADAGPGGPVSTTIGVDGQARLHLDATAALTLIREDGHAAIGFVCGGERQPFRGEAATKGQLKTPLGSVSIARVGAAVTGAIEPAAVPVCVLFADATTRRTLPKLRLPKGFGMAWKNAAIDFSISPEKVEMGADGALIEADLRIVAATGPAPTEDQKALCHRLQQLAAKQRPRGPLIVDASVKPIVDGVDFGVLSALADLLEEVWDDASKLAVNVMNAFQLDFGRNNDVVRFAHRPGVRLRDAVRSAAEREARLRAKAVAAAQEALKLAEEAKRQLKLAEEEAAKRLKLAEEEARRRLRNPLPLPPPAQEKVREFFRKPFGAILPAPGRAVPNPESRAYYYGHHG
jgi:hypothetical protein